MAGKKADRAQISDASLTTLDEIILDLVDQKVTVRDRTGTREITNFDALAQKTLETALKGSPHAQRHIMELMRTADAKRQNEIDQEVAYWSSYIQRSRAALKSALDKGETAPEILPHPDDIVVDRKKGVSILGPLNAEELSQTKRNCLLRDAYIYQEALQKFQEKRRRDPSIEPGDPLFVAILINDGLPNRFMLEQSELASRRMSYASIPGPELLKLTRQAWRCVLPGQVPRGARLPDDGKMLIILDEIADMFREWRGSRGTKQDIDAIVDDGIARMEQKLECEA